ncbi:alpha/beta hydrolase [Paraglaciecola arctica]|uniref:Esterase/lipase n=1 Tax=Paraglaciecola arctica BSs20135 TaxID=493475 RepID=K6Y1Y3_9ALTE|nr:alpha/beta hydrolase [Paraglaciecola arctica]GAC17936.1 esterase/lipase [Paraglaciecola arctica BSs20135]
MRLDNETAALLEQFNQQVPDLHNQQVSIETSREGAQAMFIGLQGPLPTECRISELNIPSDAGDIPARLYLPAVETDTPLPVVMFLHGGGWSLGNLDCYQALVASLCELSGMAFISLEYRLAPEHKYPAGLNDACSGLSWLFQHAQSLNLDSNHIVLMGDSAGANLALSTSYQMNGINGIQLKGLYLIYPVLDVYSPHRTYPSREQYGNGDYLLSRDAIDDTRAFYLDENGRADDPLVSPMFLPDLQRLPATSILVAGFDPLNDEGRQFADKLQKYGKLKHFDNFDSTIHAFLSFGDLPVAQQARQSLAEQLKADLLPNK